MARATWFLGVVALVWMVATGCMVDRQIRDVEDHPDGKALLMRTVDLYHYGFFEEAKVSFWRCVRKPGSGALDCVRECDGNTDLDCAVVRRR